MAFDAFLKIDGIDGESTDDQHKDWIELLNFDHGVDQPTSGSVSSGGSRSSQRVNHASFKITKAIDKATPKILLSCCNGTHIPNITLEICRSGGDKMKYYEVILEDVMIDSAKMVGNAKGADAAPLPVEEVSFNYGKIKWTYTQTDHMTGKASGDVAAEWDLHANKGA